MRLLTANLLLLILMQFATSKGAPRIVGGYRAFIWMYPYMASFQFEAKHICGAAILTENVLISAAHCVRFAPTEYTVRVGSTNSGEGGVTAAVMDIKSHPNYDRRAGEFDICLIFLRENLTFVNFQIWPISLPLPEEVLTTGQTVRVAGWGTTSAQDLNQVSPTLKAANLRVVDRADCSALFPPGAITDNMICAQSPSLEDDACTGDSGGPMTNMWGMLVGIVSWGFSCADITPGVYTDVQSMMPFITSLVQV